MGELFAGRYELVDPLGQGATGTVWRVWDHKRQGYSAAKLLRHVDAMSMLRFVREQSYRIDHPHVVVPAGWAGEGDRVLFTMPMICGGSAATLLDDYGMVPPDWVGVLLDQLLDALAVVHALGIVHRDLKPSNLLLEPTGATRPHLRVSDIGISAQLGLPRLTKIGEFRGTPGYLAPEQVRGAKPDPRQDLFACGAVAADLLRGRSPATEDGVPSPLEREAPLGIPAPLWAVLRRLTARAPDNRPLSADEARAELAESGCVPDLHLWPADDNGAGPALNAGILVIDRLPDFPPDWGPDGPLSEHRLPGDRVVTGVSVFLRRPPEPEAAEREAAEREAPEPGAAPEPEADAGPEPDVVPGADTPSGADTTSGVDAVPEAGPEPEAGVDPEPEPKLLPEPPPRLVPEEVEPDEAESEGAPPRSRVDVAGLDEVAGVATGLVVRDDRREPEPGPSPPPFRPPEPQAEPQAGPEPRLESEPSYEPEPRLEPEPSYEPEPEPDTRLEPEPAPKAQPRPAPSRFATPPADRTPERALERTPEKRQPERRDSLRRQSPGGTEQRPPGQPQRRPAPRPQPAPGQRPQRPAEQRRPRPEPHPQRPAEQRPQRPQPAAEHRPQPRPESQTGPQARPPARTGPQPGRGGAAPQERRQPARPEHGLQPPWSADRQPAVPAPRRRPGRALRIVAVVATVVGVVLLLAAGALIIFR